jgi:hypothetical protein
MAGEARPGEAGRGKARQVRRGTALPGMAWQVWLTLESQ